MLRKKSFYIIGFWLGFLGCQSNAPLPTVKEINIEKYCGLWYEIARFPSSFEKNLKCVTAQYTLLSNKKIEVLNSGVHQGTLEPKEARGSATIPNLDKPGELEVTFFWPFKGDYFIIELERNYQYALVGSPNRKYLWILSRTKQLSDGTISDLKSKAESLGFDTTQLEMVAQDC